MTASDSCRRRVTAGATSASPSGGRPDALRSSAVVGPRAGCQSRRSATKLSTCARAAALGKVVGWAQAAAPRAAPVRAMPVPLCATSQHPPSPSHAHAGLGRRGGRARRRLHRQRRRHDVEAAARRELAHAPRRPERARQRPAQQLLHLPARPRLSARCCAPARRPRPQRGGRLHSCPLPLKQRMPLSRSEWPACGRYTWQRIYASARLRAGRA